MKSWWSPSTQSRDIKITDGLIHDWVGSIFIPGVTLERELAMVQDYDHHKDVYKPEVIDSRLLSREGNDFHIYLRLLKKKVITVVLNTEHEVKYIAAGQDHVGAASRGPPRSPRSKMPARRTSAKSRRDTGEGFLWRLNSYWRFEERDGGVWLECEAISLTRDVPTGLGWMIEPIIRNLPKESLANTLRSTRAALTK